MWIFVTFDLNCEPLGKQYTVIYLLYLFIEIIYIFLFHFIFIYFLQAEKKCNFAQFKKCNPQIVVSGSIQLLAKKCLLRGHTPETVWHEAIIKALFQLRGWPISAVMVINGEQDWKFSLRNSLDDMCHEVPVVHPIHLYMVFRNNPNQYNNLDNIII